MDLRERLASIAYDKMVARMKLNDPDPIVGSIEGWDKQPERLREDWRQVVDDILRELSGITGLGAIPVDVVADEHGRYIKPAK